jgi:hypothetical protein
MNDLANYLLFVFAKNNNPKEFTEQIANELSVISYTPNLNYYFGPEASVFTISTLDSHEDVVEYVDTVLDIGDIIYVLLPYKNNKLSYRLPKKISEHLFNDGMCNYDSDELKNFDLTEIQVQKMIQDQFMYDFLMEFDDLDEDEEMDYIKDINHKQCEPSLDELLDKIMECGLNSLTDNELNQLKKYSN